MTPGEVAALREALAKATPGPWETKWDDDDIPFIEAPGGLIAWGVTEVEDSDLAVKLRNKIPGLLDRLEAQKKVLDLVRETEAPGGHHRLRRLHEELEDAWIALERLEKTDGR